VQETTCLLYKWRAVKITFFDHLISLLFDAPSPGDPCEYPHEP